MTPREAVASKLMQSTASMITRPAVGDCRAAASDCSPSESNSVPDALGRDDAPPAAVDRDGEFFGTEVRHRPALLVDDLDVHRDHVDGDAERRRRILIGPLRLGSRGSLGRGGRGVDQYRGGEN